VADTIREQIIAAYVTRLAAWRTAAGYNYDCGAYVLRGVPDVDESALPACAIFPGNEEAVHQYGDVVCSMNLRVEGIVSVGTTNPSVVQEKILGDAIKIMTDPSVVVTSKIDEILYAGGGPATTTKGEDTTVAAYAEFMVKYRFATGNPYSQ